MKPRNIVYRRPLQKLPNPRKSREKVKLEQAAKDHAHIHSPTERERLIEMGAIIPAPKTSREIHERISAFHRSRARALFNPKS